MRELKQEPETGRFVEFCRNPRFHALDTSGWLFSPGSLTLPYVHFVFLLPLSIKVKPTQIFKKNVIKEEKKILSARSSLILCQKLEWKFWF